METTLPLELEQLEAALGDAERDARALVDGLSESRGTWRAVEGSWSVAECLDHLATANRVYLAAMEPAAARARSAGRTRRGPALPGIIGQWFVNSLEPPVKTYRKLKAPHKITPRQGPPLNDAATAFFASQENVHRFLRGYADLDLRSVHFPNPFITGIRFSLATGLHVIASHERRHVWQAWRVRRAAEQALAEQPTADSQLPAANRQPPRST